MLAITAGLCFLLAAPGVSSNESAAALTPALSVSAVSMPDQAMTLASLTQFSSVRPVLDSTLKEASSVSGASSVKEAASVPDAPLPAPFLPVKPTRRAELPPVSPATQHTWIALAALQHGTAFFDAWSTRRSITSGNGHELNPLMKPFAGSGAMYAAIQVGPLATDYLARRLMRSNNPTFRKLWWLPQAASAVGFTFSGINNMHVASGH